MSQAGYAWLCQQIVESAQDAIVFVNRMGVIRLWNPGAETLFGYSATEAIGQTVEFLIPEGLRTRHGAGFRRVMATGVTPYDQRLLAVPAVHKDGSRLSVELTLALIRHREGHLLGVVAIVRDVTPLAAGSSRQVAVGEAVSR